MGQIAIDLGGANVWGPERACCGEEYKEVVCQVGPAGGRGGDPEDHPLSGKPTRDDDDPRK